MSLVNGLTDRWVPGPLLLGLTMVLALVALVLVLLLACTLVLVLPMVLPLALVLVPLPLPLLMSVLPVGLVLLVLLAGAGLLTSGFMMSRTSGFALFKLERMMSLARGVALVLVSVRSMRLVGAASDLLSDTRRERGDRMVMLALMPALASIGAVAGFSQEFPKFGAIPATSSGTLWHTPLSESISSY